MSSHHKLETSNDTFIKMNFTTEQIPRQGASLEVDCLGDFTTKLSFNGIYTHAEDDIIGEGAFGSVYKAHHISNPQHKVAVKVTTGRSKRDVQDVLEEVEFLRRLKDVPYVIQLIDFYIKPDYLYSVQQLARGGDVFDRLLLRGSYTEESTRLLAKNLLNAIDCIHHYGVVHRDLKLENLLLKTQENDHDILLCDFGCAKMLSPIGDNNCSEDDNCILYTMIGTAAYVAPEIVLNEGYGKKSEFWSVGCVLYCLLAGFLPFGESEDPELYPRIIDCDYDFKDTCWDNVTDDAKELISNLLKAKPEERWTAKQALQCNWFTTTSCPRAAPTTSFRIQNIDAAGTKKLEHGGDDSTTIMSSTSTIVSLEDMDSYNSAVCIQSAVRRFLGRTKFLATKQRIIYIQAIVRGFQDRKSYELSSKEIVRSQATVRGFLGRRNFISTTKRIIRLQAMVRSLQCRAIYKLSIERIVRIQAMVRGFLDLASYKLTMRRVIRAQSVVRGFLDQTSYELSIIRITRVQAMVRKFLHRTSFTTSSGRVVRVQAIFRGFLARADYKMRHLELQLMEIKKSKQRELKKVQRQKEKQWNNLKKKHEYQRQQRNPLFFCSLDSDIVQNKIILEELKRENDFLMECHKNALKCKHNLQEQQNQFLYLLRQKGDHFNDLIIHTDDLRSKNEKLSVASKLLHHAADALIQIVKDDIRKRHQQPKTIEKNNGNVNKLKGLRQNSCRKDLSNVNKLKGLRQNSCRKELNTRGPICRHSVAA